ncbi:MAG: hypothetical protein C4334_01450 [Pyrinomonas sp.]
MLFSAAEMRNFKYSTTCADYASGMRLKIRFPLEQAVGMTVFCQIDKTVTHLKTKGRLFFRLWGQ